MTVKSFLARSLDTMTFGALSSYFRESAAALKGTDEADENKFRRFGGQKRDLKPLEFRRQQEMAFYQWQRYMLPRRIIELLADFTVGDDFGVNIKIMQRVQNDSDVNTEREDAQKIWDDFYEDPVNDGERDFIKLIEALYLNGELVLPTFVNEGDGSVRLGYIDPSNVKEVVTDPMNVRRVTKLIIEIPNTNEELPLNVVAYDEDTESETWGRLTGDVIYHRANYHISQTRGHSEILQGLDWFDALEQFLFDALDGFALRNAFVWDLLVEGKTQAEIDKMNIPPPKTGSVFVHNEKSTMSVLNPTLNSQDVEKGAEIVMDFISGGMGIPKTWFSKGGDVNRATAKEMGVPVLKMLKRKQREIKLFVKHLARYVTDQAIIHGKLRLADNEYIEIEVSSYNLDRTESDIAGQSFVQIVSAMKVAISEGWIGKEDAQKTVQELMKKMGIEVSGEVDEDEEEKSNNGNYPSLNQWMQRRAQSPES